MVNKKRGYRSEDLPSTIERVLGGERKKRNYLEQFISREGQNIHKLKAKDSTGRWAYYFVLVLPRYEKIFLAAINGKGQINLEEHGTVIASCYGEQPNEEVKVLLREKYGFEV